MASFSKYRLSKDYFKHLTSHFYIMDESHTEKRNRWINSGIHNVVPYSPKGIELESLISAFVGYDVDKDGKYITTLHPFTRERLRKEDPCDCPFDYLTEKQLNLAIKISNKFLNKEL